MRLCFRRSWLFGAALAFSGLRVFSQEAPPLVPVPELGLRVQGGFRISVVADRDLADDIQAMTINPAGEVVVTSAGYIKTLHDFDDDGRADTFTLFATPANGGMGMFCDGPYLYFSGNGWFSRYEDLDGDGVADRPPENLFPLGSGEHGGHAIRKGPDGNLYLIAGNDAGIDTRELGVAGAPVRRVEAGALLQFNAEGQAARVIAHGFRNAYDFDFDVAGEMFTYDSDMESDFLLPWYTPTRIYHIAYGGHHGWRLKGWKRSWARPPYYADTVGILADMGRGSPSGVVCYRHRQFPVRYREGLFVLDWTFGRISFVGLEPDGATYVAEPELFLEPMGTHGFAPTDIAVAPDGSLLVSIGGRKTHGAVFRISYAGPPLVEPVVVPSLNPVLNAVLQAPQPLDAWSRADWMPDAEELGPAPFLRVALNDVVDPLWRVRAVEVLTELFDGLPQAEADAVARSEAPVLRARVAWSLSRVPGPNPSLVLFPLLLDEDPLVRRRALEAVTDHVEAMDSPELVRLLTLNLGHADKRVRLAAARLASMLSTPGWQSLSANAAGLDPGTRLSHLMAQMWRAPDGGYPDTLVPLADVLAATADPVFRLDAIRFVILALGDWNIENPSRELYTAYEAAAVPLDRAEVLKRIRDLARAQIPSVDPALNAEAARLLAMLQDADPRSARLILGMIGTETPAAADFHFLVCFSRLRSWPPDLTSKVAGAILNLNPKLDGLETRPKQNWSVRLRELVDVLLNREPKLAAALMNHPRFATPAHLGLAEQLGAQHQQKVAELYLAAVRKDTNFPWSRPLIELLSFLPEEQVRPLFRAQWNHVLLRDELLQRLAAEPAPADREKYWQGLSSPRLDVAEACVRALLALPRDPARTNLIAPFRLLRRLLDEPKEKAMRAEVVALISAQTGLKFPVQEPPVPEKSSLAHAAQVRAAYRPVFAWLAANYPQVWRELDLEPTDDPARWQATLKSVPWARGNAARGERIFVERCAVCHAGERTFGPDLAGVTARLSVEDLFNAIIYPSRDIAEPYRSTAFLMPDGEVVHGFVAFESADGVIVQTSPTLTERLDEEDIVSRRPSDVSFMPDGLLDGLDPTELADLYNFLRTLQPLR